MIAAANFASVTGRLCGLGSATLQRLQSPAAQGQEAESVEEENSHGGCGLESGAKGRLGFSANLVISFWERVNTLN